MFKVDGCGWAHINIGTYKERMSYLTDVPTELLNAAINFIDKGNAQAIDFDCEGRSFTLVFGNDGVYIIDKKGMKPRVRTMNVDVLDLILGIFKDVNGHINEWVSMFYGALLMTPSEEEEYMVLLKTKCMVLFELLKERVGLERDDYYWAE